MSVARPARREVVVDGPDHGVQVRHRKEPSSQCFAEPLPCGAVVEQMDLVDGALKFKRLSGIGPVSGWVSLRDADRDLLVKAAAHGGLGHDPR